MTSALPGAALVAQGLEDLRSRRETIASLLVSIAAQRLTDIGCVVAEPFADPEHRLYALLTTANADDAHGQYNALVRRLGSYARAAECAAR